MSRQEEPNRREALSQACGLGPCSCPAPVSPARESAAALDGSRPANWQIDFLRARLEGLLEIIATTLDEPTLAKVLGELGRRCGREVVKGYEGNPEGFWTHLKTRWLEEVDYDEGRGIIRIREKERTQCNCPLAGLIKLPKAMCHCSLGTQEGIYESLFNRPAKARLDESILHGGRRCAFTITLGSPRAAG